MSKLVQNRRLAPMSHFKRYTTETPRLTRTASVHILPKLFAQYSSETRLPKQPPSFSIAFFVCTLHPTYQQWSNSKPWFTFERAVSIARPQTTISIFIRGKGVTEPLLSEISASESWKMLRAAMYKESKLKLKIKTWLSEKIQIRFSVGANCQCLPL